MAESGDWEALCEALCEAVRRENHTFMNDLQVIAGWLQLGNSQRAMQYIEETKNRVRGQSFVMNDLGPVMYGLLCTVQLRAEAAGVSVSIQAPGIFDRDGWEKSPRVGEALWRVIETAAQHGFTQLEIGLVPGPDPDRYFMRLPCGRGGARRLKNVFSTLSPQGFRVRLGEVSGLPAIVLERARSPL